MSVDIWNPSTGKTTSRVLPTILDGPRAVLTTSSGGTWLTPPAAPAQAAAVSGHSTFDPQGSVDEPAD